MAAVAVNVLLTVAEIVGGVISGSLSLVADALHNLSDAASLAVALVARRIGRRPPDLERTFGYRRVELVGAVINATALMLIGVYLFQEAVLRTIEPQTVHGWTVVGVAALALAVDTVTALLTYSMSRGSLNVKAAFVHNLADAMGSVAVIVAGTLIILFELHLADVIATLLIAAYALYQGASILRESSRILALGAPRDVDLEAVVGELRDLEGVENIHHVHVWELDESERSFEAHLVVSDSTFTGAEETKRAAKAVLRRHGIEHSTLELEFGASAHGCNEDEIIAPH